MKSALGGWQISGATFLRTGTPFSITRTNDIAGVGEGSTDSRWMWSATSMPTPTGSSPAAWSTGLRRPELLCSTRRRSRIAEGRDVRQRAAQSDPQPWRSAVGHRVLQELRAGREEQSAVPHGDLQLPESPEPERSERSNPTNANFGRSISKDGNRRDIQLALRFLFRDSPRTLTPIDRGLQAPRLGWY